MKPKKNDTKKLFIKLGTCSQLYCHLLNREFCNTRQNEERALDPLAGGIYKLGYQCGMLWGSALAIGAESFKRFNSQSTAIGRSIYATQHIMKSFLAKAKSIECYDITECSWTSKASMAKYFFTAKFLKCFNIADEWTSEAVQAAHEGLSLEQNNLPDKCSSCASEAVKRIGATEEEQVMVSGFAGGLGLSGNACGALAASIWMNYLKRIKRGEKISFSDLQAEKSIEIFYNATDYEILCSKITGRQFETVNDHSLFIHSGGCAKLIDVLANDLPSK
jgi:hypothetical protein